MNSQEDNGHPAPGPRPVRRALSRVARVLLASACPARASLAASVCCVAGSACAPARSGTMQRQRLHCTSTMHQHRCSSLVLSLARAFRLAAGGAFFRTARWVARFSASRECVPSQEQHAPRSAPALLVCSHVVFCFRCAQVLSSNFAPSLLSSNFAPRDPAMRASDDGSGVFPPPVSVARRRSGRYPAARALLARSSVAFCFCCAQVQPLLDQATAAPQPLERTEEPSNGKPCPDAVASADAARSGHQQAPSAPCTSTEHPPQVVPTLTTSSTRGPLHRKRTSTRPPLVTPPRRPAHSVNELCNSTCSQFELEFDINHGLAVRKGLGLWHHPIDPMRVVHEVFAPALRRATRQAYAWSVSRRRTLRCPHCSRIIVPSPDDR